MDSFMNAAAARRLERYFQKIGDVRCEESRRGSFALYAMGLLEDGERKSVEPLAARAYPDPKRVEALHPRLLHFAVDSKWSDRHVRRVAAQYALEAMTHRESVEAWLVDDTGFLKQGQHSVGVQRQSTGSAGKAAHGQRGISLRVATRTEHLPLDFEGRDGEPEPANFFLESLPLMSEKFWLFFPLCSLNTSEYGTACLPVLSPGRRHLGGLAEATSSLTQGGPASQQKPDGCVPTAPGPALLVRFSVHSLSRR